MEEVGLIEYLFRKIFVEREAHQQGLVCQMHRKHFRLAVHAATTEAGAFVIVEALHMEWHIVVEVEHVVDMTRKVAIAQQIAKVCACVIV